MGAGRGLAREHDRVDAVFDGVGGVVHLGAGRARLDRHRLEHLRRHDDRLAGQARPAGDFLLRPRHPLERHLEAEIAARDHHRVAGGEDLLEVLERQRALQLRDQRHADRVGVVHDPARLLHVGGGLHEAERDHVDAEREAELQVLDVLRRHRRRRQRHSRRVDPLVLADVSAFDDGRLNLHAVGRVDAQFDAPVGQQQPVAGPHALREAVERGEQPAGPADAVAGGDGHDLAGRERDRPAALQAAGADLRAAQILENRDLAAGAAGRRPHARECRGLRLVSAVREVQAEDVGAGGDQRIERGLGVAAGPDGGDDPWFACDPFMVLDPRIALYGSDRAGRHRAVPRGTQPCGRSRCSTRSRAATSRAACRWWTPRSVRCCACSPRRSPRPASSRSAPRSATPASGSRGRCRPTACW